MEIIAEYNSYKRATHNLYNLFLLPINFYFFLKLEIQSVSLVLKGMQSLFMVGYFLHIFIIRC